MNFTEAEALVFAQDVAVRYQRWMDQCYDGPDGKQPTTALQDIIEMLMAKREDALKSKEEKR